MMVAAGGRHRNTDGYDILIESFAVRAIVVCPRCSADARVSGAESVPLHQVNSATVTCRHCGYNRKWSRKTARLRGIVTGVPVDPFFRLPLWIQISVGGYVLWAYNDDHLTFLVDFVGARLRERQGITNRNRSIGSRLPRWMTAGSNRENVLRAIRKFQNERRRMQH